MIGYGTCFHSNKATSFKVTDKRVRNIMNIEFDSEPVYGVNDKYIKTKIKSCGDQLNANFQGNKIPEENASYKSL